MQPTAPKSGIYCFSFTGVKASTASSLDMNFFHNSNLISSTITWADVDGVFTVSPFSTLSVKSGDQIFLRLVRGSLGDNQYRYTNFNGMLLQEEILS
jgi:C1q domain